MTAARPPSVDAVLRALDGRFADRDRDAVVAAARDVVSDERRRLADGAGPRGLDGLAIATIERLEAFGRPALGQGLSAVIEVEGSTRDDANLLLLTTAREARLDWRQRLRLLNTRPRLPPADIVTSPT